MSKYARESLKPGSIDVWVRRKEIYERHQAGETYASIARDLGISAGNAMDLAGWWEAMLRSWEKYQSDKNVYNDSKRGRKLALKVESLANAGLFGGGKRSPEYGYA